MNDTQITEYRDIMLRHARNDSIKGMLFMIVMFGGIILLEIYK